MADAPLEDRVKRALSWFGARLGRKEVPVREQIVSSPAP
jgi:hypothetical protein